MRVCPNPFRPFLHALLLPLALFATTTTAAATSLGDENRHAEPKATSDISQQSDPATSAATALQELSCPVAFARGVEFYKEEQWDLARVAWERCLQLDTRDFRVFYNLGNAWYRLGDLGHAILYYHKALLIEPGNRDARANLEQAQSLQVDQIDHSTLDDPLFEAIWSLHSSLSPEKAGRILLIAALLIGLLSSSLLVIRGRSRNIAIVLLLLSVVATFPIALSSGYKAWQIEFDQQAVILPKVVDLHSGPSSRDQVLSTLHAGTVVELLTTNGNWVQVRIDRGLEGFLPSTAVGTIQK